jgi:hypothetical protein
MPTLNGTALSEIRPPETAVTCIEGDGMSQTQSVKPSPSSSSLPQSNAATQLSAGTSLVVCNVTGMQNNQSAQLDMPMEANPGVQPNANLPANNKMQSDAAIEAEAISKQTASECADIDLQDTMSAPSAHVPSSPRTSPPKSPQTARSLTASKTSLPLSQQADLSAAISFTVVPGNTPEKALICSGLSAQSPIDSIGSQASMPLTTSASKTVVPSQASFSPNARTNVSASPTVTKTVDAAVVSQIHANSSIARPSSTDDSATTLAAPGRSSRSLPTFATETSTGQSHNTSGSLPLVSQSQLPERLISISAPNPVLDTVAQRTSHLDPVQSHVFSTMTALNPTLGTGLPAPASTPRLEVSVLDDTHGWLKVRAEASTTGDVKTSLTVSAPAHDALHAALPEMAAYLHSEGVNVTSIALHRAPATAGTPTPNAALEANTSGNSNGRHHREVPTSEERQLEKSTKGGQQPAAGMPSFTDSTITGWLRGAAHSLPLIHSPLLSSTGFSGGWVNMTA